jgi:hypothetical protein
VSTGFNACFQITEYLGLFMTQLPLKLHRRRREGSPDVPAIGSGGEHVPMAAAADALEGVLTCRCCEDAHSRSHQPWQ